MNMKDLNVNWNKRKINYLQLKISIDGKFHLFSLKHYQIVI